MNILVVGDLHIRPGNLPEIKKLHDIILKAIDTQNIHEVVLLGDTLDRFNAINMTSQCEAALMIYEYAKKVPVVVLIGNHDRRNAQEYNTEVSPFLQYKLSNTPNITIVDSPIVRDKRLYVPYVPIGRFAEAIEHIDLTDITVVFAHQDFYGRKMGGMVFEDGDTWSLKNPLVISGHLHEKHSPQANIMYVGTPLQQTYTESEDKYLHILCSSNGKNSIKRIKVAIGIRRKIEITLPIVGDIFERVKGADVWLEVHGEADQVDVFEKGDIYKGLIALDNVKVTLRRKYKYEPEVNDTPFIDEFRNQLNEKQIKKLQSYLLYT